MEQSQRTNKRHIWRYPIAGICSAIVLFTTAQAVSTFFGTASAPLVALGSTIIDFTPPWLKDLAIGLFGTNDKLFLFITLSITAALLAAAVGLAAARSLKLGMILVLGLSVLLGASVLSRSATNFLDLIPTIVGTVLGLGTLTLLTNMATGAAAPTDQPQAENTTSRRKFLLGSAGTVALGLLAVGATHALRTLRNTAESARAALGLPPRESESSSPAPRR